MMYSVRIYFFCHLSTQPYMGLPTFERTPSCPLLEVRRFVEPLLVAGTAAMSTGGIHSSVWFVRPKLPPPSLCFFLIVVAMVSAAGRLHIQASVPAAKSFFYFYTPPRCILTIPHIWFHS
jgi:hypothetical protein